MAPVIKTPELAHVMAGTAGHVDHGKTSLVKLLTGCDTDRLQEEKERGLSIDLGFAPCRIPGNRLVGIIDVPGHIDFIRNTVAGAASIDILILVVAADDGIMPQTIEHLQIIKLLKSPKLLVALTKKDLVDDDMLELAQEELRDFLANMGYSDIPIVPVSNLNGEGIGTVRDELEKMVDSFQHKATNQAFRMNVERIFSVKGHGTVVTGIPVSGSLSVGDEALLHPGRIPVRIRSVQNYKFSSDSATAGICCAINISDVKSQDLKRGMSLVEPGYFVSTTAAIISLTNISDSISLKHNSEVRFHSGTSDVAAKLKLIENNLLKPGQKTVAQLQFSEPVLLATGDKYIIRNMTPSLTVGGGSILSAKDYRYKRSSGQLQQRLLKAAALADSESIFQAGLMADEQAIVDLATLKRITLLHDTNLQQTVDSLCEQSFLEKIDDQVFIISARKAELTHSLCNYLKKYHQTYKYTWGLPLDEIPGILGVKTSRVKELLKSIRPEFGDTLKVQHGKLALASFEPAISQQQIQKKDQLLQMTQDAGINCLPIKSTQQELGVSAGDMQLIINILCEEGEILTLGKYLMTVNNFDTCKAIVLDLFKTHKILDINDFREKIGIGRNTAVLILEKMDELNITRRTESGRALLD